MKQIIYTISLDDKVNKILLRTILIVALVLLLVLLYRAVDIAIFKHHVIKVSRLAFDDNVLNYIKSTLNTF